MNIHKYLHSIHKNYWLYITIVFFTTMFIHIVSNSATAFLYLLLSISFFLYIALNSYLERKFKRRGGSYE